MAVRTRIFSFNIASTPPSGTDNAEKVYLPSFRTGEYSKIEVYVYSPKQSTTFAHMTVVMETSADDTVYVEHPERGSNQVTINEVIGYSYLSNAPHAFYMDSEQLGAYARISIQLTRVAGVATEVSASGEIQVVLKG